MPAIAPSGGSFCVITQYKGYPTPAPPGALGGAFSSQWQAVLNHFQLCPVGTKAPGASGSAPGAGGAAPPPGARVVVPPALIAATYWQAHGQNLLPRPRPEVAPGYALTGERAYMETGAPLTATFTDATPAGTLTITASGALYVDWGDGGGWTGPFRFPGRPWPGGRITHVYTQVGTYAVVVQERWTATWSLAGQGGGLAGLATEGSLPAFPARQLQSVRNR
ncbi:MAG: hypothetical protein ACRD0J_06075 [Acidimicrobiales bacterium]